jgi:hypothetical protein
VEKAPRRRQPGERPTVVDTAHALLHHYKLDWSQSTMRNAEDYLLRGRWPGYLAHEGIVYIDQLSPTHRHSSSGLKDTAPTPALITLSSRPRAFTSHTVASLISCRSNVPKK